MATTGPRRGLSAQQLAFVRAWAEGVDLQQAALRYLDSGAVTDARQARAALQGLLDQLRGVARAHGRPDLAALLRRDPAAMAEAATKAPSLDEFRAQQPEDFYSEAELLALYTDTHGAPDARSGTRRRQRLRARQLAALQWLEGVAVREPQPADTVGQWLDERLAARLAAVGLTRLDQLQAWIRRRGFHWHRHIPRVGAVAAARVQRWLQQHARTLGALPAWAQVAPGQLDRAALLTPRAGLASRSSEGRLSGPPVPLERLDAAGLPQALTGRHGHHRATGAAGQGGPAPGDDLSALHAWLGQRKSGSPTWRAYRKEAERLLLWALWVAGKPVSSLDAADLPAYQAFLTDPPASWTAPRGTPRWHEAWRPFEGPLSARSAAMALGIVRSMLDAWVAQGHLAVNSWTPGSPPGRSRTVQGPRRQPAEGAPLRALPAGPQAAMAHWMERRIGQQGHTPALLRLQALWAVACGAGLRPAELVSARTGWLIMTTGGSSTGPDEAAREPAAPAPAVAMALAVPASTTAGDARTIALDRLASQALQRYLVSRRRLPAGPPSAAGLDASCHEEVDAPLFAQLRSETPLSPARLYEVMAQAFASCADDLARRDPASAAAIRQASTHWLRHGFGLQAAAAGEAVPSLQYRMGHRSRASVAVYRRAARAARSGPWAEPTSGASGTPGAASMASPAAPLI